MLLGAPGGGVPSVPDGVMRGRPRARIAVEAPCPPADLPVGALLEVALTAGALVIAPDELQGEAAEAAAVLDAIGGPARILAGVGESGGSAASTRPRSPAISWSRPPMPRRLLLGTGRTVDHEPLPVPVGPDGHPEPIRWAHRAVEAALATLPVNERSAARARLARLPRRGARLRAGACAGTGTCVRTCPTGALDLVRRDGVFMLDLAGADCVECGLCVQFCPADALDLTDRATWGDGGRQRLRVGSLRPCTRCGAPHGRSGGLCAVCAFRRENPTGVRLPPGFVRPRDR